MHVSPTAESFVAGTSQDDDTYILSLAAVGQSLADFLHRERGEGIAITRAVDGDACYTVIKVEENFLKLLDRSPVSHGCSI